MYYGDLIILYPKPYSIYLRGTVTPESEAEDLEVVALQLRVYRA